MYRHSFPFLYDPALSTEGVAKSSTVLSQFETANRAFSGPLRGILYALYSDGVPRYLSWGRKDDFEEKDRNMENASPAGL